ncbi:MAG: hypothetical protein AAB531_02765 [Patescibacteria group bacterium]
MKLPLSFSKEQKKEFFLALVLRNEKINAVFMEEVGGKIHVLSKHAEAFEKSIEESSTEEILETADKAISQAEQRLPEKLETVKTIFGVKGSWVEDNKIKKEYLEKLKKISDELGLVPIGFLVIFEAISYLLEKEEGTPVSIILAETGKKFVSAALIKGGKIKEFKTSEITTSPATTLDNILKHFSSDVLPPKIVVFNGEEDESQEFINHKWSSGLSFIQIPQVTTLPSEFDARAVLFGAATQLGFEVLDKELPEDDDEEIPADFKSGPEEKETDDNIKIVPDESSMEYFGFVKDKDIAKEPHPKPVEIIDEMPQQALKEQIEEIPEVVAEEEGEKKQLPVNAFAMMLSGKSILSKLFKNLSKLPLKSFLSLPGFFLSGGKMMLIPLALILLILIGGFFYFFSNKAAVVLSIDAKPSEKTQDVTFSSDSSTDPSNGILASQFISATQEGNISASATGKKEVGEKAKGTVTIFNNADSSQNLSSGATITSANDRAFTLDKAVTVPAASGDVFSGTTPGKVDVAVTAKEIGQDSNIPSDTKFSIGTSVSMAAKNDNAFSGGSKKEVTVVSEDDIEKLEAKLLKDLESKGKDELTKKISGDEVLLPVLISEKLVKKDLSKKANEEASKVTLTGTVEYKGISYKKSDLVDFANEVLKNEISQDEMIDSDSIEADVGEIDQDEDKISARVAIKAFVVPKINEEEVIKKITGKSFNSAKEILTKYPQVSDAKISLSFSLPFLPQILPFSSKNIKITTQTK